MVADEGNHAPAHPGNGPAAAAVASRGLGRVQRQITRAFIAKPSELTTAQLFEWCYPRCDKIERKHRVAIVRAAKIVAERVRRDPGGVVWRAKKSQPLPK